MDGKGRSGLCGGWGSERVPMDLGSSAEQGPPQAEYRMSQLQKKRVRIAMVTFAFSMNCSTFSESNHLLTVSKSKRRGNRWVGGGTQLGSGNPQTRTMPEDLGWMSVPLRSTPRAQS